MALRYNPGESYEDWMNRVHEHELIIARKRLAKGEPVEQVLEEFSNNIAKKSLHPILKAIQDSPTNYDAEASKRSYNEKMKQKGASSDHVAED